MAGKLKKILLLTGATAISLFFIWFGFKFLFYDVSASSTELFIAGCAAVLTGVVILGNSKSNARSWGLVLILVGFYFFARVAGVLQGQWLLRLLGLASLLASGIVIYSAIKLLNQPKQ